MHQLMFYLRSHQWGLYLFYALIFLAPFQTGTYYFIPSSYINGVRIDYLALSLYLTDCILMLYLLTTRWNVQNKMLMLAFLALIMINCALAQSPLLCAYKWIKFGALILLFLNSRQLQIDPTVSIVAFLSSAVLEIVLCGLQLSAHGSLQGGWYFLGERLYHFSTPGIAKASIGLVHFVRPYGTFSHPNALGGYFALLFAWLYMTNGLPTKWYVRALLLLVSGALVIMSFSKNAIGALGLVIVAPILWSKRDCGVCILAKWLLMIFLASFALIVHSDPLSLEKRLFLATSSLQIIAHHPFFGVGLGNYLYIQNEITNHYYSFFLEPVHNILFLLLAEVGVIGVGLFLYSIWYGFGFRKLIYSRRWLLVLLVTGMFDHYWLTQQQNILLIPILFGLSQKDSM